MAEVLVNSDTFWYRAEIQLCSAGVDEWDNPVGPPNLYLYLRRYKVVKTTAKGVWLNVYGEKRFVLLAARKRFAYPTEQEAYESFIARAERRCRILESQVAITQRGINLAKSKLGVVSDSFFV